MDRVDSCFAGENASQGMGCGMKYVWCSTHSQSPRKHGHPDHTADPRFDVTLGSGIEDRIVTAKWSDGDVSALVSINVETLREMIAIAESYKPGSKA